MSKSKRRVLGGEIFDTVMDDKTMELMITLIAAQKRIAELEKALEYAISEADKWYDNDCGGPVNTGVNTPEMDAARELLSEKAISQ